MIGIKEGACNKNLNKINNNKICLTEKAGNFKGHNKTGNGTLVYWSTNFSQAKLKPGHNDIFSKYWERENTYKLRNLYPSK